MTIPVSTLDRLYPANCFFCARTTRQMMAWNVADANRLPAYRLDATPAQLLGVAGKMPFVAHEAASSAQILDFLQSCGLPAPSALHRYRTADEAGEIALGLIGNGLRLVHNFGSLPVVEDTRGLLIPMQQYLWLNAKGTLPILVRPQHQPQRRILSVQELQNVAAPPDGLPVYLKVAGPVSNGGGSAVRYCADENSFVANRAELAARLSANDLIIVEKDYGDLPTWCTGVAILDGGIEWLGASLQLFSRKAVQAGNVLFRDQPPPELEQIAIGIAQAAHATGYRGIAGFDVGKQQNGPPVVFDLNFRPNSSTGLLLAGLPALQRSTFSVAHSFFLRHDGPLQELIASLATEAGQGRVVPGSVFDRDIYQQTFDDEKTRSCLDGWILADSVEDAVTLISGIRNRLVNA